MNIYGKEASAYYELHQGLRFLKRGERTSEAGGLCEPNDPIRRSSRSSRDAVRGLGEPEMDGERGTHVTGGGPRRDQVGARGADGGCCRSSGGGMLRYLVAAAVLLAGPLGSIAAAQYPRQAVEMTVLFGGSSATIAQVLADAMSKELGVPVAAVSRTGRRGRGGICVRQVQSPERLQHRLEFELDQHGIPQRQHRLRLPGVRSGRADRHGSTGAGGSRRFGLEDAW